MDDFSLANQLLILSAGRRPAWRVQTVSDDVLNPPAAASDGVTLSDAVVAGIRIDLREDVAFRTVRVTFPTLDLAANITVTIAGTGVVVNGPFADKAAIVDALVTAIAADGTVGPLVAVTYEGTPHDTLLITGKSSTDYSVTASSSAGGTFAYAGDAASATAVVFGVDHDTTGLLEDRWALVEGISYSITQKGLSDRVVCGGYDRLYVQVTGVQRVTNDNAAIVLSPTIHIGPCGTE